MRYLSPPHVQLGFYWESHPEAESFATVFRWLLSQRYEMHHEVLAVRSKNGRFPRFSRLGSPELPDGDTKCFMNWLPEDVLTARDWLPVTVQLSPRDQDGVALDLGYCLQGSAPRNPDDRRVIELTISGSDLNLYHNRDRATLTTHQIRRAKNTDAWCNGQFKAMCQELCPDYASYRWEFELQGPRSLLGQRDAMEFEDIFLSDSVSPTTLVSRELAAEPAVSVSHFNNGTFIEVTRHDDTDGRERAAAIVHAYITSWIQRHHSQPSNPQDDSGG